MGQKSTKKRYMRANRSNRKASEPQSATRRDTRQTDRTKKSAERKTTGNQHKTNETKRNKTTAKKVKRPSEGNPSGAPAGRSVARPEGMPTRSMGGGSVKKKQAYPHSCGPTIPTAENRYKTRDADKLARTPDNNAQGGGGQKVWGPPRPKKQNGGGKRFRLVNAAKPLERVSLLSTRSSTHTPLPGKRMIRFVSHSSSCKSETPTSI